MHICKHICVYAYLLGSCHICRCARIYASIYPCVLAYMRKCMHLCKHIFIYAYTLISKHICICACISASICACILVYLHICKHVREHICIYAGIFHANISSNISADMLAYTMFESVYGSICAHTLAYMHRCKHIRKHICIYPLPPYRNRACRGSRND